MIHSFRPFHDPCITTPNTATRTCHTAPLLYKRAIRYHNPNDAQLFQESSYVLTAQQELSRIGHALLDTSQNYYYAADDDEKRNPYHGWGSDDKKTGPHHHRAKTHHCRETVQHRQAWRPTCNEIHAIDFGVFAARNQGRYLGYVANVPFFILFWGPEMNE